MGKKTPSLALDKLLLEQGFASSIESARAKIMAGEVIVNDQRADKAGHKYPIDAAIRLRSEEHPYVSRGGLKLAHALKLWPISLQDKVCIDIGASTGGFSEVLLLNGAKKVYAVDVGYGQLAHSLRIDSRIVNLERTHILDLSLQNFSESIEVATIDLSFISLERVLPHIIKIIGPDATIVALIKPQFEAQKEEIGEGGIVRDGAIRQAIVERVLDFARDLGLLLLGHAESPILGAKGNVEYLAALRKQA